MTTPTFIDTEAVAHRLGMNSANAFLAKRRELEDNHRFPMPMPHWQRPLKWRVDQVDHWISTQGTPKDTAHDIPVELLASGKVRLLAEARRA